MKVRILGSASGVPMPGRYNEAVLVQVGQSSYLFDAGEPCAATIHNSDVSVYSIKAVFISHPHADHVGGLPMLLQVMWLWQSRGPEFRFHPDNSLRVYVPSDFVAPLRQFLRALRMGEGKLPYRLFIEPIQEGVFYRDLAEAVTVSAYPTTHLSKHIVLDDEGRPYINQAYAFVLEAEGKKLVYSGDLGSPTDIAPLLDNTDLLIMECAHFTPEKLFECLALEKVKHVLINHIHPSLNNDEERILQAAKEKSGAQVGVARDKMQIEV